MLKTKLSLLNIGILISFIWAFWVLKYSYDPAAHLQFGNIISQSWQLFLPLLILLALFWLLVLAMDFFIKKPIVWAVPIWVWGIFFIFSTEIFIISKSLLSGLANLGQLPAIIMTLTGRIGLTLLFLSLVSLAFYSIGRQILNKLNFPSLNKAIIFLVSLGLGMIIFTSVLLILSILGQLKALYIVGLLILLLFLGANNLKDISFIWRTKIKISSQMPVDSFWFWLGVLVFFQSIVSFAALMAPLPMGYDSLSYYFILAKELAVDGKYITGQYAMPIELLYASGIAIFNFFHLNNIAESIVMHWAWWASLLGLGGLWFLGKQLGSSKAGFLAGAIYYTMPLVGFYQSLEPKMEIFFVPFFIMALLVFWQWLAKQQTATFAVFASFLFFLFTIKITSLLGIIPLLIIAAVIIVYQKKWALILPNIAVSLLCFIIIIGPWFVLHIWEQREPLEKIGNRLKRKDVYGVLFIGRNYTVRNRELSFLKLPQKEFISTGFEEDYNRYLSDRSDWFGLEKYLPTSLKAIPMARYLIIPWNLTTSQNVDTPNFMLSPLYLIWVPLIFLFFIQKKRHICKKYPKVSILFFWTAMYFSAWLIWGRGISWYGMGLFIPLSIGLGLLDLILAKQTFKWWRYGFLSMVFMTCFIGLLLQLYRFSNPNIISFAIGKIDKKQSLMQLTSGYVDMADIINNDPQIQSGEKFVLISGSYLHYFLNRYYDNVLNDLWLDDVNMVLASVDYDYNEAVALFKKLGVKYIIFDTGLFQLDQTADKTLTVKHQRFMDFASKKLLMRGYNQNKGIMFLEIQ